MRAVLALAGLICGVLLLAWGMPFGVSWPLIVSVLGFGLTILCVAAVGRRDADSLRNWLLAALFADPLVVWGVIELLAEGWEGRLRDFVIDWTVLWFAWQVLFWVVWLLRPTKEV